MRQFDTAIFSATPPPNLKTDHLVLKEQLLTVTNLQLPKSAQASSWHSMSQSLMWTLSQLMKWKPSLLWFTRLYM
jgi:hypothetical protein